MPYQQQTFPSKQMIQLEVSFVRDWKLISSLRSNSNITETRKNDKQKFCKNLDQRY